MNTEHLSRLNRRAEVHAALGDPARIHIVDLLVLGDRSPSELQHQLEIRSNLLAHHLGVLESAGVIDRTRSEADRRRTYWTLRAGVLDSLAPQPRQLFRKIVFVCTHNSARSQLAAALWTQHSSVPATSAGTSPAEQIHPGAVAAARRHHIPLSPQHPRRLDFPIATDDVVIAVCDNAHETLDLPRLHWSVPDPTRTGDDASFDHAISVIKDRIARFAPTLIHQPEKSA